MSHYPHKQACGNEPPPVQGIPRVTASEGESGASRDMWWTRQQENPKLTTGIHWMFIGPIWEQHLNWDGFIQANSGWIQGYCTTVWREQSKLVPMNWDLVWGEPAGSRIKIEQDAGNINKWKFSDKSRDEGYEESQNRAKKSQRMSDHIGKH